MRAGGQHEAVAASGPARPSSANTVRLKRPTWRPTASFACRADAVPQTAARAAVVTSSPSANSNAAAKGRTGTR